MTEREFQSLYGEQSAYFRPYVSLFVTLSDEGQSMKDYIRCSHCGAWIHKRVIGDHLLAHRIERHTGTHESRQV